MRAQINGEDRKLWRELYGLNNTEIKAAERLYYRSTRSVCACGSHIMRHRKGPRQAGTIVTDNRTTYVCKRIGDILTLTATALDNKPQKNIVDLSTWQYGDQANEFQLIRHCGSGHRAFIETEILPQLIDDKNI